MRLCFALLMGFAALAAFAQVVPDTVSYQGKLTDTSGLPIADGSYDVQFQMYTVLSGGSSFWTSDTMTVQTAAGVFSTVMQHLTPSNLSSKTDVWIETLVAPHGGSLVALAPRVKLAAVPFAIRAADVALPFAGSVSSSSTAVSVTNTGTASAGNFQVSNASNSNPALTAVTNGAGAAIQATGTTAAALMGNVGIGMSTPAYPLDVAGIIRSSTGGFRFPDGSTQTAAGVTGSGTDNYLVRWNGTGAVQASAVYQADDGNVGVGTAGPGARLTVVQTSTYGVPFAVVGENLSAGDTATRMQIQDQTGGVAWMPSANNDGSFSLHQGGVGDRIHVSNTTGEVAIAGQLTAGTVNATGDVFSRGVKLGSSTTIQRPDYIIYHDYVNSPAYKAVRTSDGVVAYSIRTVLCNCA